MKFIIKPFNLDKPAPGSKYLSIFTSGKGIYPDLKSAEDSSSSSSEDNSDDD